MKKTACHSVHAAMEVGSEEHKKFLEYLALQNEMECRERELYYWSGHVHCYDYMRKIGALRNGNE